MATVGVKGLMLRAVPALLAGTARFLKSEN